VLAFAFGGITFVIIGVLFVVMGLVPLVLGLRAAPRELFLGVVNALGVPFAGSGNGRPFAGPVRMRVSLEPEGELVPTAQDWLVSIVLFAVSAGAGVWLGNLLFASFGGAAA
jgi:hypothetical protein